MKGKETYILKDVSGASSGFSEPVGGLEQDLLLRMLELEAQNPPVGECEPKWKSWGRCADCWELQRKEKGGFSPRAQWGPEMASYCSVTLAHSRHDCGAEGYKASAPLSWHVPRVAINGAVESVF